MEITTYTGFNQQSGDGWVSVEKELPKEGGRYWCYIEHVNDLGISHFQWNCAYHEVEKRFSGQALTDGERVTHWRPLPQPPSNP